MTNHPNRSRTQTVEMTLTPADVRALRYVLSHLDAIVEDYPETGSGGGHDAGAVKDMHRGVQIVRYLAYCGTHGQS